MKESIKQELQTEIGRMIASPSDSTVWTYAALRAEQLTRILRNLEIAEAVSRFDGNGRFKVDIGSLIPGGGKTGPG